MSASPPPGGEDRFAALAARMEAGDFGPLPPAPSPEEKADFQALLDEIDSLPPVEGDEPTPPMPPGTESVNEAEVRKLVGDVHQERKPPS